MRAKECRIGRASRNDLVLAGPDVSRTHAAVEACDGGYRIVDLGSGRGVYVGGVRVRGYATLKHGDLIRIGECLITFKLPDSEAAATGDATHAPPPKPRTEDPPELPAVGVPEQVDGPTLADAQEHPKERPKRRRKGLWKRLGAEDDADAQVAYIDVGGEMVARIVGAVVTVAFGLAIAGRIQIACRPSSGRDMPQPPLGTKIVAPITFGELNTTTNLEYNSSGLAPIDDSRCLVVEDNTSDALYELDFTPAGAKTGPLLRRPFKGLAPGLAEDLEAITIAEENGKRYLFAISSMQVRVTHGVSEPRPAVLLRITINADDTLAAENVADIRTWLVENCPDIGTADILEPVDGGLNVEGLAWDPARHALLLGFRTPLHGDRPIVVPIHVKDLAGPWDVSNLQVLPSIYLDLESGVGRQGIRDLQFDPSRGAFLVLVGNDTTDATAPFRLYLWDGTPEGTARLERGIWFAPKMKPEGITHMTIGGRGCIVVADDRGGYQVIWDDDPRLR